MRIRVHAGTIGQMPAREPTRLTLEVEEVEPIAGRLLDQRGRERPFTGWLGLAAALGRQLPNEEEQDAASASSPSRSRTAAIASAALLALEAFGTLLMWAPIPLAWLWVGGRVYSLTGSLGADLAVVFLGFIGTVLLTVVLLHRVDAVWIEQRRRAGHDQQNGALSQVAIVSGTFGLIGFTLWYYLFSHAYVLPFMPSSS